MMLDGGADDMLSRLGEAENREVVGFGAAAGEDNLGRAAPQQSGNGLARALHRHSRLLSMMMERRRVPEMLPEVSLHGLKDRGQHGSGGVVVEIDMAHGYSRFYAVSWGAERSVINKLPLLDGHIVLQVRRP